MTTLTVCLLLSVLNAANEDESTSIDVGDDRSYGALERDETTQSANSSKTALSIALDRILQNEPIVDRDEISRRTQTLKTYTISWNGSQTTIDELFPALALRRSRGFRIFRGFDEEANKMLYCVPIILTQMSREPHYLLFVLDGTDAKELLCATSKNETLLPFPKQLTGDQITRILDDFLMVRCDPSFNNLPQQRDVIDGVDAVEPIVERRRRRPPESEAATWEMVGAFFAPLCIVSFQGKHEDDCHKWLMLIRIVSIIGMLSTSGTRGKRYTSIFIAMFAGTFWYYFAAIFRAISGS